MLFRSAEQLRGKKVLIMGLGTKDGGVGAALYAARHEADVTVTDLRSSDDLKDSLAELGEVPVSLKLGSHDERDFLEADIVIRNPGIKRDHPYLRTAESCDRIVDSPIGIFSEMVSSPYIGITGTKGKSFTTHLVHHILEKAGVRSVAAGNNCVSPLRFLDPPRPVFVLELSSWQLSEMGMHEKSPHIGCWLSFFPDHLDYYRDLEEYWQDKSNIFRFQSQNDILVVPWDDPRLRSIQTDAYKLAFSTKMDPNSRMPDGCFRVGDWIVFKRGESVTQLLPVDEVSSRLQTPHHLALGLAAVCCASAFGAPAASIRSALRDFVGLPHRFETVKEWRDIVFVNDSAATTPESVICALDAVKAGELVLIFGAGGLKELSFDTLSDRVVLDVSRLVLFHDDPVSLALLERLPEGKTKAVITVNSMAEAVERGAQYLLSRNGGTLLLSPGCSGAPRFTDLFVRGDVFRRCVENFTGWQKGS